MPSAKKVARKSKVIPSAVTMQEVDEESMETHKTLVRFPGGLTLLTFKTDSVDIKVFKAAMLQTELITSERFDELYMQIVANDTTAKGLKSKMPLFLELISSEVMLTSQKPYTEVLSTSKGRGVTSMVSADEFGKRKFVHDSVNGYGIYRVSDNFVTRGTEHLIANNIVQDYNQKRLKYNRPIYEANLPSPFPDIATKDKKFFYGEPFQIQGYQITEKTKVAVMAEFGLPDWCTSTGSKLIFCSRKGDMFVLTTGRAVDVIAPYVDASFVPKITSWIREQPRNVLHQSALFNNRHRATDVLIGLSTLSRVFKGEPFQLQMTGTLEQ